MGNPLLMALPETTVNKSGWPWIKEPLPIPDKLQNGQSWPLVTVVTPSYNQAQFLEATIRSVLLQGYTNLEYIVIDGGSSDSSRDIISRYADHLDFWVSENDRGQSHAINKGLARAKGSILGWLNSDDVLLPGAISRVVAAFQEHPDADVVYGHLERIDAQGQRVGTPNLPKDRVVYDKTLALDESVVNQAGCFWRRSMMEKVGLLNEGLHYCMDYEYWTRILLVGGKFVRLNDTLAQFRLSSGSKTVGQTVKMAYEGLQVIDGFFEKPDIAERFGLSSSQLRKQANKGRSSVSLHAFYGCMKEKRWAEAARWFVCAHIYDPLAVFRRKWLTLALARVMRK
jgi:glycosyltransferase involved in cell wall biosynthesis